MRISNFGWHIIRLILGVSFIVFAVKVNFVDAWQILQGLSFGMGIVFLGIFLLIVGDEVYPIYPIRYRIIKNSDHSYFNNYLAEKLILKYILIPVWCPVDTKLHTYKTQNFFGAEETGLYRRDVNYKTEDDARDAIEKHKESLKKERVRLFKRPDKKIREIIKV